jgi:hypothetical protein
MITRVPIHRVRMDGGIDLLGHYDHDAKQLLLERAGFPLLGPGEHDVEGDLPWQFFEVAPQGFLGRELVRSFLLPDFPKDPSQWSAEQILWFLATDCPDLPGNLVLGALADKAVDVRLRKLRSSRSLEETREGYEQLARFAEKSSRGSTVGGDRPKFTVEDISGPCSDLLVKYTRPIETVEGRRWADLLRLEAHCAAVLSAAAIVSSTTTVHEAHGRCFLEVGRFDRLPGDGRRGAVTLYSLGAALYGEVIDPIVVVESLVREGHLTASDVDTVKRVHAFSRAIGNTDAHLGNYGLVFDDDGTAHLAPIYDVTAMVYAPRNNELPDEVVMPRSTPPLREIAPLVDDLVARVESDAEISRGFLTKWRAHIGR